jgi:hypothetical protein
MKKKTPKKLQLTKLKIASLQTTQVQALMGGNGVPTLGKTFGFSCGPSWGPECYTDSCP